MKKRGFTLIELVVVIALIAILAVTLAPRLRDQIAKAKDSKAIGALGALRTASEIYFADNEVVPGDATDTDDLSELESIEHLVNKVDKAYQTLQKNNIKSIRQYCNEATPAPWYYDGSHIFKQGDLNHGKLFSRINLEAIDADMKFCARARTDLPKLLDLIEKWQAYAKRIANQGLKDIISKQAIEFVMELAQWDGNLE